MKYDTNPFDKTHDADKAQIWNMLVLRDIDAFIAADWAMVENDFMADKFMGVDGGGHDKPQDWKMTFPTLNDYKTLWLSQAVSAKKVEYAEDIRAAIHRVTSLTEIDINQHKALVTKKFNGQIKLADGGLDKLNWQTLYFCEKQAEEWKITGFIGYLPYL
ncbi:MAG: hypothetical protein HRU29_03755 [Rhizobiales bacterium]|nr:hypothetical protein [Hyphomicrobiales bacterium]NRB13495.1 hypothetical protein [Hyphomicrobiales bacterium]